MTQSVQHALSYGSLHSGNVASTAARSLNELESGHHFSAADHVGAVFDNFSDGAILWSKTSKSPNSSQFSHDMQLTSIATYVEEPSHLVWSIASRGRQEE
jgi:hypothetical protein